MIDANKSQQLTDLAVLFAKQTKAVTNAIKHGVHQSTIEVLQMELDSTFTEIKAIQEDTKLR